MGGGQRRLMLLAVVVVAATVVATVVVFDRGDRASTTVAASDDGGAPVTSAPPVDVVLMDEPVTQVPPETTTVVKPAPPPTTTAPPRPRTTVPLATTTTAPPWVPPAPTCQADAPALTRGVDLLAIARADGLHEVRIDGTVDRTLAGTAGTDQRYTAAVWDTAARHVAYQVRPPGSPYQTRLTVVDLERGCWRMVTPEDGGSYEGPTWSFDGRVGYRRSTGNGTTAFAPDKAMLEAVSAADPTKKATFVHGIFGPHWAPDGSGRIAFADEAGLKLLDSSTGKVSVLHATTSGVPSIEWSPDARSIAFAMSAHYRAWVVPADGSRPAVDVSPPDTWQTLSPSWSPDSRQLAFSAAPRNPPPASTTGYRDSELWVVNADGSDAKTITSLRTVTGKAYWSPDGRRIAIGQRADGAPNAAPIHDVVVVDAAGDSPPVVVAKDASLLGFFRRDG